MPVLSDSIGVGQMADAVPDLAGVDVAIVGGGAAGVLTALHLLADPAAPQRAALIEPAAELGGGAAYATLRDEHLLNVPAGRMSAFEEDPGHFVRYLVAMGLGTPETLAAAFVPRREYGRYLRAALRAQPGAQALHVLRDRVERADAVAGGNRLRLASGRVLDARRVVLAVGNRPRRLPPDCLHGDVPVIDAWDDRAVAAIPADADVCIIGSGLSMVDAVLCLAGHHHGRIRVVSRHGLLPQPHAVAGPVGAPPAGCDAPSLRVRFRAVRAATRAATAAGEPWQWVFDALRPQGQRLWAALPPAEQRRFLRHAVRHWDIHRHRIAPAAAASLAALRRAGRLTVQAARLQSLAMCDDGRIEVRVQPRHATQAERFRAHRIVNATGIDTRIASSPDDLLGWLLGQGRIAPGPHGLGMAVTADGLAVDAAGRVDPGLLVIGALRMGALWETTAIHEIRQQARQISLFLSRGAADGLLGTGAS